jgi:hypothetical protein
MIQLMMPMCLPFISQILLGTGERARSEEIMHGNIMVQ